MRKGRSKMHPARPGRQHYSHCRRAHEEEEEDVDAFVNPLAPPPAVGLSLGEGKTLRGISLGSQPLLESKVGSFLSRYLLVRLEKQWTGVLLPVHDSIHHWMSYKALTYPCSALSGSR